MKQPERERTLFDSFESGELKRKGMERAALTREQKLALAREVAIELGRARSCVTADDVGVELQLRHGIDGLGPAAGSIFKTGDWIFDGDFRKSTRATNHSRLLRVWRYVGAR